MAQSFTLSWPNPILSPNARPSHWSRVAAARKAARHEGLFEAMIAKPNVPETGPVKVSLQFRPADNRRRDLDNAIASMKAALDGIAEGIGVNDSRFALTLAFGEPHPPLGQVVVTIGET